MIICKRKPKTKCYICGKPMTSLCDATRKDGKPCDMPMCDEHRNRIATDLDVCKYHNYPKFIEQARENRIMREDARLYFKDKYKEINTRMLGDMLLDFATKEEVDEWIDKRKELDRLNKKVIEERQANKIIAKMEQEKSLKKSIETLGNLITQTKTQHMLKDMDGEATTEDIAIYRDEFVALNLGRKALEKQVEILEWLDQLDDENENDMKLIKEIKDILGEVFIL